MDRSDRSIANHEKWLAKLTLEQRETVIRETSRLFRRLRVAARFENRFGYKPISTQAADDSLLDWLKAQPPGSRITKIERKKE